MGRGPGTQGRNGNGSKEKQTDPEGKEGAGPGDEHGPDDAVAAHIKDHDIDKVAIESAVIIYDNQRSKFTLHRTPLLLAEKK